MSPWLHDRVTAWLSPRAIVLTRSKLGLGARNRVDLRERAAQAGASLRDWSRCAEALESELAASGWRNADLDVHLSDHFVRYLNLPWRAGLRGRADWDAYAAHELQRHYGDGRGAYEVRIAAAATGANRIAAAIEHALLARLRACAESHGLRLRSVGANGARIADRYRGRLTGKGRLLVAEPARLTLFDVVGDRWAEVRSVRASGADELTSLLMESKLRASGDAGGVVHAWGTAERDPDALARLGLELAPLQPPASTPQSSLALGML